MNLIPLPSLPKVVQKKGNYAQIEIGPFYPGYGVTIGNTFRRILLSSLPGSAISKVKIKGASHEFSTLPGVLEDIIMVLLNLKKIRFKNWSEEPETIILKVKGERKVIAKDFQKNPQLEIINPDCHIAALTDKKTELEIEAVVEKGIGYSLSEEREDKKIEAGVIAVDAVFTPMKKVNFRIENVRVAKRTDFEKLVLEIETDGTIDPEQAFAQAADILFDHFSLFAEFAKKKEPVKQEKPKIKEKPAKLSKPVKKKPAVNKKAAKPKATKKKK